MRKLSAGLLLLLWLASPALAQQVANPLANAGAYGAYNSGAPTCVSGFGCWLQTDINGNLKITGTIIANGPTTGGGFPSGAVPITATGIGTTAATSATLTAVAAKTTYICGFTITADATSAIAAAATVTGTISGSLNYIQNVGAATAAGILTQTFYPCIPASAVNTNIVITSAAAGLAGNTNVNAWGFNQ